MSKFFLVDKHQNPVSSAEIMESEREKVVKRSDLAIAREAKNGELILVKDNLLFVKGRIIIKADTQFKNSHTFKDGTKLRLERQFNEFNRRITQPVNGIVISAEHIPEGSEILIGHNSLHETNRITNYVPLSGDLENSDVKYYSLPEAECFAWRDKNGELQPMKNYAFALRVFKPYKGSMEGIEPTKIKDVLYITTGEFKGQVVHVLAASDYEIIYQGLDGRESHVIRLRHFEEDYDDREEITAIAHDLTEKVNNNELLIGLTSGNAKYLKENVPIS
jgi:hypothetical protein